MLIEPTPTELARDREAPARVMVTTTHAERYWDPSANELALVEAADAALTEAETAGYKSISYESVVEFIRRSTDDIVFEYAWTFTAWRN